MYNIVTHFNVPTSGCWNELLNGYKRCTSLEVVCEENENDVMPSFAPHLYKLNELSYNMFFIIMMAIVDLIM